MTSASYSGQGSQAYVYDRYGNMTSKAGVSLPVSATTNHLTNATYDARGNLTVYGSDTYTYDGLAGRIGELGRIGVGREIVYFGR